MSQTDSVKKEEPYRVLARKYRPSGFDELIGQEALVRTLKNAIDSGRIAHAFMLTGIRGTGKTTTARIIAKAINYVGPDGKGQPTTGSTDDCALCKAITDDRHPDVIEMDAASRTGVDDIRDIIDGVRYAPSEARYKVYIIDEVHMLSKNAFNALLKTLEEPPEHVKFIFATTEIRKVPITILSRCQRFDLRRVSQDELESHYKNICDKEGVKADDEAIAMIARSADGSVRDGLSLLDQAISLADGKITVEQVKAMLGLNDRGMTLALLKAALSGNSEEALNILGDFYEKGQDPIALIQDLTETTHALTKLKAAPKAKRTVAPNMTEEELHATSELSSSLTIPVLGKAWQILLNGTGETVSSSNPQSVLEMVIIRLCYAANLPDPSDLIKKLKSGNQNATPSSGSSPASKSSVGSQSVSTSITSSGAGQATITVAQSDTEINTVANANLRTLEDIAELMEVNGALKLSAELERFVQFIALKERALEIALVEGASQALPSQISKFLSDATGQRWVISVGSQDRGEPTLYEKRKQREEQAMQDILDNPMVKTVMEAFPGAEIIEIKAQDKEN